MRRHHVAVLAGVALAALASGLSAAIAADAAAAELKREWQSSLNLKDEKRGDAQATALERVRGSGSVEVAQAVLALALGEEIHWKAHPVALAVLESLTAEPVRAWALKAVASEKDARARILLAPIVATYPEADAAKALIPLVKDKDPTVVTAVARALTKLKRKDVVAGLVAALKDAKDGRAQEELVLALRALTGQNLTSFAEWEGFWTSQGESFVLPGTGAPAAGATPTGGEPTPAASATPRTTSNGSGIYETITSKHVCFVIDNSFSMRITAEVIDASGKPAPAGTTSKGGDPSEPKKTMTRLEFVQKELCAAIETQLDKKAQFNVIAYSTKVTPWKAKLVEASDANRKAAKAWVMALKPEDETNTYDALEAAFTDKAVDTIYLLTDGFPTNGKFIDTTAIRGEIKRLNATRKVRIHTIAYVAGDGKKFSVIENKDMSKNFMKALAEESGGTYKAFD